MNFKTIISCYFLLLISGCSKFDIAGGFYDTNEYAAFTNVAFLAKQTNQVCNERQKVEYHITYLRQASQYAVLFTKHQVNNNELHEISKQLDSLVEELQQKSINNMSETYCVIKTKTILDVAETAMHASGAKRRR